MRADRTYDAGATLTRRDMLTELSSGNVTVLTEIPGSQLLAALENGVAQVEIGSGRFPQVSVLLHKSRESWVNEQTEHTDLQDPELAHLQQGAHMPRSAWDLV